ncbi:MAG: hypothetical protein M9887_08525 [Chitinophagales bacterium]|nr:hypothetical protein [Chitinophagales bacterium]
MYNRKIVTFLMVLATSLYTCQVSAQSKDGTPFAKYGLGLMHNNSFNPNAAMGGLGATYHSPDATNFENPATLAETQLASFEVGIYGYTGKRKTNTGSVGIGSAGLDYLAMAFPVIRNHWGFGAALLPFSTKNSFAIDSISFDDQKGVSMIENDGHLYNFIFSNGFKYKEYSLGFNIGYLFGNLTSNNLTYALDKDLMDAFGNTGWNNSTLLAKAFIFQAGAHYNKAFKYGADNKKQLNLTLGLTGAPSLRLGKRSSFDENISVIDNQYLIGKSENQSYKDYLNDLLTLNPSAFDTLSIVSNKADYIKIPGYIQAGIMLSDSVRWMAGFDFRYQPWSQFNGYDNTAEFMQNSWRIGIGGEFLPSLSPNKGLFSRLKYRLGFNYERTNLNLASNSINEFGINVGFGIPIVIRLFDEFNTRMYVYAFNLSVEAGSRGTLQNNLIRENYAKLKLGINLNANWFQKRKYY